MDIELQEKLINVKNLCNDILQNLVTNNIDNAKQKSWLLHEVICTKFGKDYGEKEE